MEFPLTFVTAGLVGLGGLGLVMGTALSSLAELLALMPGRSGWIGGDLKSNRHPILKGGTMGSPRAGEGGADAPRHSDGQVRS
jgi:hypothetical protein